jgi:hypothetical protein
VAPTVDEVTGRSLWRRARHGKNRFMTTARPPNRSQLARAIEAAALVTTVGVVALAGCAATAAGTSVDRLGPDRFALKCRGALAQCLVQVDELCQGTRYTVESASDTRDYLGPHGMTEHEVRSSEATIRCGSRGMSIFGGEVSRTARVDGAHAAPDTTATTTATGTTTAGAVSGPPSSPPTSAIDAKRACVPGATQTCVGPGACRGGQSCLSDGSGFSVCDCGGGRAAAPSSADAPSSPSSSTSPP